MLVFTDLSGGTKQQRTTLSESASGKLFNFAFYPKTVAKLVSQKLFLFFPVENRDCFNVQAYSMYHCEGVSFFKKKYAESPSSNLPRYKYEIFHNFFSANTALWKLSNFPHLLLLLSMPKSALSGGGKKYCHGEILSRIFWLVE